MHRYKDVLSLFVLVLLATCHGCSGSSFAVPVSHQSTAMATETPLAAAAFGDSIGVNLHLTYGGTPYDTDFSKWSPILISSGIKHVREGVCTSSLSWCRDVVSARLNTLGDGGITAELSTSLKDSAQYDAAYVTTMGLRHVDGFEGPNECDSGIFCPADWQNVEGTWQKTIFSFASPNVTIIGPSMVSQAGYACLGDLSGYMNVGNLHDYPGADPPETLNGGPTEHEQWAAAMSGSKPFWVTETGYATDASGVPPVVQERYITRTFFEDLRLGIMRTYIYQLFDYGPDAGAHMGLLNADYSAKPAFTQLKQLLAFFKDNGSSLQKQLTYEIQGDTRGTLHHVLFQRSDGTYALAMWLADPVYDAKKHSVMDVTSEAVRVVLPGTVASATQTLFADDGTTKSQPPLGVSEGTVSVMVTSVVSVLTFSV